MKRKYASKESQEMYDMYKVMMLAAWKGNYGKTMTREQYWESIPGAKWGFVGAEFLCKEAREAYRDLCEGYKNKQDMPASRQEMLRRGLERDWDFTATGAGTEPYPGLGEKPWSCTDHKEDSVNTEFFKFYWKKWGWELHIHDKNVTFVISDGPIGKTTDIGHIKSWRRTDKTLNYADIKVFGAEGTSLGFYKLKRGSGVKIQ